VSYDRSLLAIYSLSCLLYFLVLLILRACRNRGRTSCDIPICILQRGEHIRRPHSNRDTLFPAYPEPSGAVCGEPRLCGSSRCSPRCVGPSDHQLIQRVRLRCWPLQFLPGMMSRRPHSLHVADTVGPDQTYDQVRRFIRRVPGVYLLDTDLRTHPELPAEYGVNRRSVGLGVHISAHNYREC
jgi:hypothetical protein